MHQTALGCVGTSITGRLLGQMTAPLLLFLLFFDDHLLAIKLSHRNKYIIQENMAMGLINLQKAYDTVPRDMAMATLRWMGVPDAEMRMVE